MALFVICGKNDCKFFHHATYVADYLSENLPNFRFTTIIKNTDDWAKWLKDVNHRNKWHHVVSPLIWKEVAMRGGKPHYIGALDRFWEYCYDYYNLESFLNKTELTRLVADFLQYLQDKEAEEEIRIASQKVYKICLLGASHYITRILLPEILKLEDLYLQDGLCVTLFDNVIGCDDYLNALAEDSVTFCSSAKPVKVDVALNMVDALKQKDLLICLKDIPRTEGESIDEWINRNLDEMLDLADVINYTAKKSLRVVLANNSAICFNATALADTATAIRHRNIVAVTADLGLQTLNAVAQSTGISISLLGSPPVWGFIGITQLVDIDNITERREIFRPNLRALKNINESTLPQGKTHVDLRTLKYRAFRMTDLSRKICSNNTEMIKNLERNPCLSRVRATVELLKYWHTKNYDGEVLSLGVCSDGTFGIPNGLVFSQPASLKKAQWVPEGSFPMPKGSGSDLESLLTLPLTICNILPIYLDALSKSDSKMFYKMSSTAVPVDFARWERPSITPVDSESDSLQDEENN